MDPMIGQEPKRPRKQTDPTNHGSETPNLKGARSLKAKEAADAAHRARMEKELEEAGRWRWWPKRPRQLQSNINRFTLLINDSPPQRNNLLGVSIIRVRFLADVHKSTRGPFIDGPRERLREPRIALRIFGRPLHQLIRIPCVMLYEFLKKNLLKRRKTL